MARLAPLGERRIGRPLFAASAANQQQNAGHAMGLFVPILFSRQGDYVLAKHAA
jgi:hypothetical protein